LNVVSCHSMKLSENSERKERQKSVEEAFKAHEKGGREALGEFIRRKEEEREAEKTKRSPECSEDK
jgi:hypothetical protein